MFYQNILTELSPYSARVSSLSFFGEHRHADIEIHYPLRGAFEVQLNKKSYTVKEGEVLLISPMVAHAFPTNLDTDKKVLTLIVGVSFLTKYFSFSQKEAPISIFVGEAFEFMNESGRGEHGHIAIETQSIERAVYHLERRGVQFDYSSTKYDEKGRLVFIYLTDEINGFAYHLVK